MVGTEDVEALAKTLKLMEYLAEVTDAAERHPVRDVLSKENGAPETVRWLTELPNGIRFTPTPHDDVILRLKPPRHVPEPRLPEQLLGWTDSDEPRGHPGRRPELLDAGPRTAEPSAWRAPSPSVLAAFDS
jgi:hypothetical protein